MLNAEIPSDAQISTCAEGWDCEEVGTVKYLGIYVRAEDGEHETVRHVKQSKYLGLSCGYLVVMYFL